MARQLLVVRSANCYTSHYQYSMVVYCLLITLTCSPKAELRRAQLNGIGRMHVKGASGSRQTAMNDPGAQQPSQMFLTWVKARPQHRELHARPQHRELHARSVPYSLRIACGFKVVGQQLMKGAFQFILV